jgi:death on curing protein
VRYLTVQEVLYIHDYIIHETGGSHGIHNLGLLESAVARAQATFGGEDLYIGLFLKAAALFESLARNHAFVDGNKRTAIAATESFLFANGWELQVQNLELEEFVVDVVVENPGIETIAIWFKANSTQR